MCTWSAVVLPIVTIASVMAAVISRRCWSVRPAYHCTVMLGMGSSCWGGRRVRFPSAKPHHVVGEIGAERVGLHDAVGIEPHGQVLAQLDAGLPLAEEPAPGLIAAVEADLVGLAEDALERRRVRLPYHSPVAI